MTPAWHTLVANLAVVAVFFGAWASAQHMLQTQPPAIRRLVLGLCMGIGACASMLLSFQLQPGAFLDLRATPLAVAAFFGGPIAGLVAGGLAAAYRLLAGGPGMVAGLTGITLATLIGYAGYLIRAGRPPTYLGILLLASAVGATTGVLVFVSMAPAAAGTLPWVGPTLTLLSFVATAVAGIVIIRASRLTAYRDLLRAALTQAPDYQYVKDRDSRFVEVNRASATIHGFADPSQLVGKTDHDLITPDRAKTLFEAEQEVMRSGIPRLNYVEALTDEHGIEHWYSTSKVPLRDSDGTVIGLSGVTRDITEHRRLEAELRDSRNLLSYAVEEMADGLAMFDRSGRLVYSNDRYRGLFPLTGNTRKPGAHFRDILRAVVESGEQLDLGDPEKWIDTVAASLLIDGEEQVRLHDGRWLQIRTRPTTGGASMVVVSDVTTIRRSEGELRALTAQLKALATTDSLTGLMNRRALDQVIEEELVRTTSEQAPLSLVLFDVDRFKAYNDCYGHPAGDLCLKQVSMCLVSMLPTSRDVAARYGGEEFVALLPDSDEDGAYGFASRVREALIELNLPHTGSEFGMVTLSAGIATYGATAERRSAGQLIGRADDALYQAKEAGRNRVTGWQNRHLQRAISRAALRH